MTAEPHGGGEVDCFVALNELDRFLDGEIPAARIEEIREHIAACYPCEERVAFERQLRELIRERSAENAPPSLVRRVRACLAEVRDEGAAGEQPGH